MVVVKVEVEVEVEVEVVVYETTSGVEVVVVVLGGGDDGGGGDGGGGEGGGGEGGGESNNELTCVVAIVMSVPGDAVGFVEACLAFAHASSTMWRSAQARALFPPVYEVDQSAAECVKAAFAESLTD